MKQQTLKNKGVFILLVTIFFGYNIVIYTQDARGSMATMPKEAIRGEKLWQENNCVACHQIYGLGGYLGPDLTNIISSKNKGEMYVEAFINSGSKSMPQFDFSENEKRDLVAFLTHIDQTGYYPNYNAKIKANGWVNIEYK